MTYSGSAMSSNGTMNVISTMINRIRLPGNSNTANAKPASELTAIPAMTVTAQTKNVLSKAPKNELAIRSW